MTHIHILTGFKFKLFTIFSEIKVCLDPESSKILAVEILSSYISDAMALVVCRIIEALFFTKHVNFSSTMFSFPVF